MNDKLFAQLRGLSTVKGREAALAVAQTILQRAQVLVPVDTGELRDSGNATEDGVEFTSDHAGFVEFGTSKMAAQPYLRPAVDENKDELAKVAAVEVEKEVREKVR